MQILRISCLIFLHILILLHVYVFGDSVIGSVDFQEFFHSFIKSGIINAGVILVLVAFLTTLIFGRFFCGWACHFGAIQELSWWILNKLNIKPKTINSKLTFILPAFILIYFYFTPNLIYAFQNPWHSPKINLAEPEIWAFLPGFMIATLTFFVDGFLIVYFLGRKGFCRFICPWGAFLKIPNAFAMYKVRKTGNCINTNFCTTACPVAIDVSYEINNYNKVTNTNCTSCMLCINGCPSNALSYEFKNPFDENIKLKDYFYKNESFKHKKIKDLFTSIRDYDYFILFVTLIFSFCIDGLYGIGHFLSFGIGLISSIIVFQLYDYNRKNNYLTWLYGTIFFVFFFWHGIIKFSIWQGTKDYENNDILGATSKLELVIKMYPQKMSKFHVMLGELYLIDGKIKKAKYHVNEAIKINPNHNAPQKLKKIIENRI